MKRYAAWTAALVLAISLTAGCGDNGSPSSSTETIFYAGTDSTGQSIQISRKPEKIILLSPSFLGIMHAVGGDFDAWANSPVTPALPYAENKPTVGFLYQVNTEAVVSRKPDLVVGMNGLHNGLVQAMEMNGIPMMLLDLSNHEDVQQALRVLGDVAGQHEKGVQLAAELEKEMKETEEHIPKEQLTAAILRGTAQSVMIERTGTIASETAELLHIRNVFAEAGTQTAGKMLPFSIEALAVADPDILFLTSMGMPGQAEQTFKTALADHPAWPQLRAVREGKVYYLPQELFLSNPGVEYPKALRYMAHQVHPDKVPYDEEEE